MGQLDGKIALVTGAASGIGRATVERFSEEGARVCCVDVDPRGQAVADAVGGVFVRADAGESSDVDRAFAACELELGGLDIAYLNAGIAIGLPDVTELSDDTYQRIMRVNVDGVVFGTRAAIRGMQRHGGGGAIVATSSLAGLIPFPPDPVYDLSKHAVVGFIRSVAPTLAPLGITANTVNPGMTDTNILTEEAKAFFAAADFPLMPPAQIADAVLTIITSGRTGSCWVCQPGREPEPYRFHDVPGPRTAGAEGRRPPQVSNWGTG